MTMQAGNMETTVNHSMGCMGRLRSGCMLIGLNLLLLLFVAIFIYLARHDYQLDRVGLITTGTVISQEESSSAEGDCCVYAPVIQFKVDGISYTFASRNVDDSPRYDIGEQIEVQYDPGNPSNAEIEGSAIWMLWAGLAGLILLIMLVVDIWGGIRIVRGQPLGDE